MSKIQEYSRILYKLLYISAQYLVQYSLVVLSLLLARDCRVVVYSTVLDYVPVNKVQTSKTFSQSLAKDVIHFDTVQSTTVLLTHPVNCQHEATLTHLSPQSAVTSYYCS